MPLIFRDAHLACEEWIFAEGVVAASELEVAINVDEGLQGNVDAQGTRFAADDEAIVFCVFDAERCGNAHGGGFGLRGMAREDAGGSISKAKAGNMETRNAGEVSGLSLIDGGIFVGAVDQGEFFFQRHLAQKLVDAGIAGDYWDGLRERESCSNGEKSGRI